MLMIFYLSSLKFAFGNNILMKIYECICRWQIYFLIYYTFSFHTYINTYIYSKKWLILIVGKLFFDLIYFIHIRLEKSKK